MPLQPSTTAHLDHVLASTQRTGRMTLLVAGLVRGGGLVWTGAVGTVDGRAGGVAADADTQYRMGSITKTFVAVCVLRLRDAGRLDLADRFGVHVPGSPLDDVTVEQLLTHAGGVQAETDGPWWERTPGGDWAALALAPAGQRFLGRAAVPLQQRRLRGARPTARGAPREGWFDVVRDQLLSPPVDDAHDGSTVGCGRRGSG